MQDNIGSVTFCNYQAILKIIYQDISVWLKVFVFSVIY